MKNMRRRKMKMSKWKSTSIKINSATEEMVKSALKDGWRFDLLCEGQYLCRWNRDFDNIMEHIHSIDGIVEVHIDKEGEKTDWCNIILHNGDPDCEIADCTVGGYIDKWCDRTDFGQKNV
jgi:hypothetical protein